MFKKKNKEKVFKLKEEKSSNETAKTLKNPLLGINFWVLILSTAILLTIGIWIIVDKNLGVKLAVGTTGAVLIIAALLRIIPLIKGVKNKHTKISIFVEMALEAIIGILLFTVALILQTSGPNKFTDFIDTNYKYFLGSALYIKALFYLLNTSLFGEDTHKSEFIGHIIVLTISVIIFGLNFDAKKLGLVVAVLCLICALGLGINAGYGYFKYRKSLVKNDSTNEIKEDIKTEKKPILDKEEDNTNFVV